MDYLPIAYTQRNSTMTIEKTINGYWRISTMHNNHLFTRIYIGYTKKEAIRAFKEELKS